MFSRNLARLQIVPFFLSFFFYIKLQNAVGFYEQPLVKTVCPVQEFTLVTIIQLTSGDLDKVAG